MELTKIVCVLFLVWHRVCNMASSVTSIRTGSVYGWMDHVVSLSPSGVLPPGDSGYNPILPKRPVLRLCTFLVFALFVIAFFGITVSFSSMLHSTISKKIKKD